MQPVLETNHLQKEGYSKNWFQKKPSNRPKNSKPESLHPREVRIVQGKRTGTTNCRITKNHPNQNPGLMLSVKNPLKSPKQTGKQKVVKHRARTRQWLHWPGCFPVHAKGNI